MQPNILSISALKRTKMLEYNWLWLVSKSIWLDFKQYRTNLACTLHTKDFWRQHKLAVMIWKIALTGYNFASFACNMQSHSVMSSNTVQCRQFTFEIFHLFAHHRKVQLNVVLMTADDAKEVKFELVQHLKYWTNNTTTR